MSIDPRALPAVSQWDDKLDTFVKAVLVKVADFLPSLLGAVIVLVAFWGLHRLLRGMLNRSLSARTSLLAADILRKLLKYVVLGIGLLMAASQLGFNVLSMLAGLGVAGLAVGLAAKDTMANFIAGLIILWDKPFALGDDVEIGETPGWVRHIELRTTILEDIDGNDVILPNSDVVAKKIINYSRTPRSRLHVPIGIAYGANIEAARTALLAAAAGDARLLESPAPVVIVTELADSAVVLELIVWAADPSRRRLLRAEYLERAKNALDRAGIPIPFPQREVRLLGTAAARA
ncbi:MAG TPA: mechanosensitive ion channel family protein [Thermoanaerobaculia bacterium]|nr:mechanosensitive ion channel family protein [Thermoanaerobaculia bacterium]